MYVCDESPSPPSLNNALMVVVTERVGGCIEWRGGGVEERRRGVDNCGIKDGRVTRVVLTRYFSLPNDNNNNNNNKRTPPPL